MKTTVVIPNYNGIEYIKPCLESLYACKGEPFDIIVVDDASTDDSVAYLQTQTDKITLLTSDANSGFAASVNRGIAAATTQTVILLNNDTTVESDFVTAMVKAVENERVFSASAKMVDMHRPEYIDGAGDFYCALGWAFAYGKGKKTKEFGLKERKIFSSCGGAAIYKKSILEKIGLFDEAHFAYLEDVDLGYRAAIEGYKNVYAPQAVCYHAGSASSGSRYNEFKINLSSRNSIFLIYKNMPFLQFLLNLPFILLGIMIKTAFFAVKGYGKIYLRGVIRGILMCLDMDTRSHKVRFRWRNLGNYVVIQFELWINLFRRLVG